MNRAKSEQQPPFGRDSETRWPELFKELPEVELAQLETRSEVREIPAGHLFFHVGEKGDVLYWLERGQVETFRSSGRKKLIIAQLGPGEVLGEMACVGPRSYHCSAIATSDCRVRVIAKTDFEALMRKFPSVASGLLDLISRRFVDVLMDLDGASFRQLIPRIAKLLLQRADGDEVRDLTHAEIAERLRVYRESATAALGELRKAGIVTVRRKRIRILDRGRLEKAARE